MAFLGDLTRNRLSAEDVASMQPDAPAAPDYAAMASGAAPSGGGLSIPGGALPGVSQEQARQAMKRLQAGDANSDAALSEPPPNARAAIFKAGAMPGQGASSDAGDTVSAPGTFRRSGTPAPAGGGYGAPSMGRPSTDYEREARRRAGLEGLDSKYSILGNEAEDRARLAGEGGTQAQMAAAQEQSAAAGDYRSQMASQRNAEVQFQKQHQDLLDKQRSDIQQAMAEHKRIGEEDPTKQTAGEHIQASIALALGAFGAGLTRGPNTAMEILNKKMDDKIAQHRLKLETAKGKVEEQNSLYGQLRQQGLDHQTAAAADKVATLDDYKARLEQAAASAQVPEIRARADQAIALADAQKAKEQGTIEQGLHASAYQLQHADAQAAAAGAAAAAKHAEERGDKDREYALKVAEFNDKRAEREATKDKSYDAEVQKYGERLGTEKIPEALSIADRTKKAVEASGGNPEGFSLTQRFLHGVGADGVANALAGESGRETRRNVDQMVLALAHAKGRVSPAEVAEVRKDYLGNESPEAIKSFLKNYTSDIAASQKNIEASTTPQARALYKLRQMQQEEDSGRGAKPAVTPNGFRE